MQFLAWVKQRPRTTAFLALLLVAPFLAMVPLRSEQPSAEETERLREQVRDAHQKFEDSMAGLKTESTSARRRRDPTRGQR